MVDEKKSDAIYRGPSVEQMRQEKLRKAKKELQLFAATYRDDDLTELAGVLAAIDKVLR